MTGKERDRWDWQAERIHSKRNPGSREERKKKRTKEKEREIASTSQPETEGTGKVGHTERKG